MPVSSTNSQSLLKLMSIKWVVPSNHLIFCRPLLLLPSIFPSIKVFFQWVSSSHQVAKVLELQLQHQFFQWIFRMYFLSDGLVGSPCSPRDSQESSPIPQFKSINPSAFSLLYGPISHPYMTTGKTIALTRWTFVGRIMSLLFSMLSRLVITFLQRSKRLLISWLLSPSAVILEPRKIKSATVSPSICHEVMGPDAMILVFWMLSFKLMINYANNGYPIISKFKIWLYFIIS